MWTLLLIGMQTAKTNTNNFCGAMSVRLHKWKVCKKFNLQSKHITVSVPVSFILFQWYRRECVLLHRKASIAGTIADDNFLWWVGTEGLCSDDLPWDVSRCYCGEIFVLSYPSNSDQFWFGLLLQSSRKLSWTTSPQTNFTRSLYNFLGNFY